MGKPSAPAPPDYESAATATAAGDLETARLSARANRVDEYTPEGQRVFTELGNDRWRADTSLTPEGQQAFDANQRLTSGLSELGEQAVGQVGDLFSSRYQSPQEPVADFGTNRQNVMDAMLSRIGTDIGRDREATGNQLVAQGIPRGSDAFNVQMEQLDRKETDARQQAEIAATGQAVTEQNAGLDTRRQGIQEALMERQTPLNEISAFRTGSQVGTPNFGEYGAQAQTGGADFSGGAAAQSKYNQGLYNADVSQSNSLYGGLAALGSAAIYASDRRLKENIVEVASLPSGIPVYEYNYIGSDETEMGVMAQEVLPVIPAAVITMGNGFMAVNYGILR